MEHNSGKHSDAFTYMRRPVELKWYEQFSEPQQAIEVEKKIKGWSRKKKIAIIENRWGDLPNLSKNYTQHGSSTGSD
ncbi:hypothetical protein BXY75_2380 [Ulvibacter antarcticus]|uniref:GIY-YIG domain-containing protein n=2 Tax=Ulvibacter antarcticus TaxID=442714 RepID=A0A3L9YLV7_9FLAO|nr:hypothetical protein BXY75_2380 [Ulvibacter antarcticus]